LIGLIADTHGLLRPEALAALQGVSQIIHAGDVGAPEVLEALNGVAPVTAIRGNVDHGMWVQALPATRVVEVDGRLLYVLHDLGVLDLDPAAAGFAAVISGHSHQPRIERRGGVLYVNPGSAGPRRFKLPVSLARLSVVDGALEAELIQLHV
jgi:putative phosphoesterase